MNPPPADAEVLVLDHYLEVLKTKPGALPGADRAGPSQSLGSVYHHAR
jgi:hypothetical protein